MPRFDMFFTRLDFENLHDKHDIFRTTYFIDALFNQEQPKFFEGLLALPNLGLVNSYRGKTGTSPRSPRYFTFPEKPTLKMRELPPLEGERRFSLDGSSFPVFLWIEPSGLFEDKNLILGYVEVTQNTPDSLNLFELLKKAVKTESTKTKYYGRITYVGKDAAAFGRKKSNRLTANPRLKRSDDLKIDWNDE